MSNEELFKTPPHSIESEQSVIGGLLLDNEKFSDISVVVRADDFYTQQHQLIYTAISHLDENSKPFDLITDY